MDKRLDNAEGGVPEYWIVNPVNETILVLVLNKKKYRQFGNFARGSMARSSLLEGFEISVDHVFDAD